ncbi:MAG: type I-E CRISPR-associated endoribonuclease Cas2e [bacterium]
MTVLILECVPSSLRGELSRWFIEIKPGVFVGSVSALVRDLLWKMCCKKASAGSCLMVYTRRNEQGFDIITYGEPSRKVENIDGLILMRQAK